MFRILVAPFVLLAHLLTPTLSPETKMLTRVSQSVAFVEAPQWTRGVADVCTGIVIDHQHVLTARHCVGPEMYVDNVQVVDVRMSTEALDLALLRVPTARPPAEFEYKPPVQFEHLTALGFGDGYTRVLTRDGRLLFADFTPDADVMAPGLLVDTNYVGGMSGGPVVNDSGKVVGMTQRSNSGAGYGVGAGAMREFIGPLPR